MDLGPVVRGVDRGNKPASFRHYIVTDAYNWVFGSSSEVALSGSPRTEAFLAYLQTEGIQRQLRAAAEGIIAVGTASEEGNIGTEVQRAGQRANTLIAWVRGAYPGQVDLYTLTLGQYRCPDRQRSSDLHRRIILIASLEKDPETNVAEALKDALAKDPAFPDMNCYSNFGLDAHSTAPRGGN
jgi:hypothetical protein